MTQHLDDALLVRWMDGELAPGEQQESHAHVTACGTCAERRALVQRRAARLSELLRAADSPIPAPSLPLRVAAPRPVPRVPALRAAAVLALLGATAVAVPPVRAWIGETARAVWRAAAGTPVESSAVSPATVAFVPAGPLLTVRVAAQARGAVAIEVVPGERAAVIGVAADDSLLVLPAEVRLGAPGMARQYVIHVPPGLDAVRVVQGETVLARYAPARPGERWIVPLGNR